MDVFFKWKKFGGVLCFKFLIKVYMKMMVELFRWIKFGDEDCVVVFYGFW